MNYDVAIKSGILIFPLILLISFFPYIISQYHKYGSVYWYRALILFSFFLYLIIAYFLVIMPLPTYEEVLALKTPFMRLEPFAFVSDFVKESGFVLNDLSTYFEAFTSSSFYVPVFNILLFIPLGIYLHYYFEFDLKKTIFISFLLSLFFELTQLSGLYFIYPRSYRLFDIDDLILNTFGGLVGFYIGTIFLKILPSRQEIDEKALKLAQKVSLFRRGIAFLIDIFIISFLANLINQNYYFIIFCFYFGIFPIIFHGQTLGMKFVHLRIVSIKKYYINWYQYFWRYSLLFLEFLGIIFIIFWVFKIFYPYLGKMYILVGICLFIFIVLFYIVLFLKLLFHKYLFYELVSDTKIVNTKNKL